MSLKLISGIHPHAQFTVLNWTIHMLQDVEEPNLQQANMTETTTRFRLLAEQSGLPQVPTVLGGSG